MQTLRNKLIAISAVGILAVVGSLMNSHQAVAQQGPTDGLAVRIVNPLPVPTTGSTTVSGTVAATQSGPWNVGITGNTASTPLFTRDADNPARHPFQTSLCDTVGLGQTASSCVPTPRNFTLPSDRRLVIEFISGTCITGPVGPNALNQLSLGLGTSVGGTNAQHTIQLLQGLGQFDAALQTRIYADAGTRVGLGISAGAGATNTSALCSVALSGYTITP